jgi:hypothetical protein
MGLRYGLAGSTFFYRRVWTKILLIDRAANLKGHNARSSVLGRVSDHGDALPMPSTSVGDVPRLVRA